MIKYLKQWKNRLLHEESADFFKPVISAGKWIGGLGAAILAGGEHVPTTIHDAAGYMITAGLVAAFIGASSKNDKPKEDVEVTPAVKAEMKEDKPE